MTAKEALAAISKLQSDDMNLVEQERNIEYRRNEISKQLEEILQEFTRPGHVVIGVPTLKALAWDEEHPEAAP